MRAIRRSAQSKTREIIKQPEWLDCQLDEVNSMDLGCDVLVHLASHSVQYPFDSLANAFAGT